MDDATASAAPPRSVAPNTLLNVVLGAVVTTVTAPLLPFAAIVGGAVTGYLQRSDLAAGAKLGAVSGAVAAVPAFALVWAVVGFWLLGLHPVFALTSAFAVLLFVGLLSYLVAAGAVGGALGAYLRRAL